MCYLRENHWFGLIRLDGQWHWTDNNPSLTYANWFDNEREDSTNTVAYLRAGGKWGARKAPFANGNYKFVCKKRLD